MKESLEKPMIQGAALNTSVAFSTPQGFAKNYKDEKFSNIIWKDRVYKAFSVAWVLQNFLQQQETLKSQKWLRKRLTDYIHTNFSQCLRSTRYHRPWF